MKNLKVVSKQQVNLNSNLLVRTIEKIEGSKEFNKFRVLDRFNRAANESHVKVLIQAIIMTNYINEVIIIRSKAFGGVKYFRGDGQHRMLAAQRLDLPFDYRVVELVHDTVNNVIDFINILNNSQKGWNTDDYLTSQAAKGIYEYEVFLTQKELTGLTITDLENIYLGANQHKTFKNGTMKFIDEKDSKKFLEAVLLVLPHIPKKSFTRRSLYKAMRLFKDYNKVANIIIKAKKNMDLAKIKFSENEHDFYNHIVDLCKGKLMFVGNENLVTA